MVMWQFYKNMPPAPWRSRQHNNYKYNNYQSVLSERAVVVFLLLGFFVPGEGAVETM